MYRVITLLLVLAICLTAAAPQAQATLITANGVTVFSDGSENSAVGVIPALTDPSVGTWTNLSAPTPRILTLTGPDTLGDAPGAFSGDNYLVLDRTRGGSPDWSATFPAVDPATTALRAEFMIFIKAAALQYPSVAFYGADNLPRISLIQFGQPGSGSTNISCCSYYPVVEPDTGLDFISDAWNKVVLDWDPAVSLTTMKLTVNGSTVDTLVNSTLPTGITRLRFTTGGNGTRYYLDAVPEPSTLALLATGLIGLLCYAWRKRK